MNSELETSGSVAETTDAARTIVVAAASPGGLDGDKARGRLKWFAAALVLLCLLYGKPLFELARYAATSSLYSHILLIPVVSAYVVWLRRGKLEVSAASPFIAVIPLSLGCAALALHWGGFRFGSQPAFEDAIALPVLSLLGALYGATIAMLGWKTFKALLFPSLFLLFAVPFPAAVLVGIETVLQHGSALVAHGMLSLSGMPVLRDSTFLQLPGIRLQVAPECSGIHSTLVLFITSIVAGHFFLKNPLHRAILTLAVIPLALLRNGFRIFTIGQLCVHYGPDMIHSYIHRKGGPIFFALSLIPLFVLLIVLLRLERKARRKQLESHGAETNHG